MDHDSQYKNSQTGSIQCIRTAPDFFVDRENHIPAKTGKDQHRPGNKKIGQHFIILSLLLNVLTHQVSEYHLHNGWHSAYQTFGVKCYALSFINMVIT